MFLIIYPVLPHLSGCLEYIQHETESQQVCGLLRLLNFGSPFIFLSVPIILLLLPPLSQFSFLILIYCNLLTDLFKFLVKLCQIDINTINTSLIIPWVFPKMFSESSRKCYTEYSLMSECFIILYRKFDINPLKTGNSYM